MSVPALRDVEATLAQSLREDGALGLLLVEIPALSRIEHRFGEGATGALRQQLEPLLVELRGRGRPEDVLAHDDRESVRYLVFLNVVARRARSSSFQLAELDRAADEAESLLSPRVTRLLLPYSRERQPVLVGTAVVPYNPLLGAERLVHRLVEEAADAARLRVRQQERSRRNALLGLIINGSELLSTAFQPIVEMGSRDPLAHEALSRGPRGTELEPPLVLFSQAAAYGLTDELERACRRVAFRDWDAFGAPGRLFVNTVPATVRDPSFLGRGVVDMLGPRLSPRSVTLEITEREAIENLGLFREAMHSFLDLGFSFAIDDLGAGYSGLETVASLGASYLKIDMGLVRDVHQKPVSRQIIKAILEMGQGIGATVIAEGIETEPEAAALQDLGVRYGQGYLFGRPIPARSPAPAGPR
jgi:EAL domain-containing protein (putative c-di-GMP-specific phosphodiesterase class I)